MSYKKLSINYEVMMDHFRSVAAPGSLSREVKGNGEHVHFVKDDKDILIIVYRNGTGQVTLTPSGGNAADAESIIAQMLEVVKVAKVKNFSLSSKGVEREAFDTFVLYLTEEVGAERVSEGQVDGKFEVKLKGQQGDILTFSLYDNGTLLIQGRPVVLVMEAMAYLHEEAVISEIEAKDAYEKICGCSLPEPGKDAGARLYPNAYGLLDSKLRKTLNTAACMFDANLTVDDNSVYCFPALRLLEGFIKGIIFLKSQERVTDFGGMFDSNRLNTRFSLNNDWQNKIDCSNTCSAVNECYSYYRGQRHTLFHADGMPGLTRIPNRAEALGVAKTALNMIERHSTVLKGN